MKLSHLVLTACVSLSSTYGLAQDLIFKRKHVVDKYISQLDSLQKKKKFIEENLGLYYDFINYEKIDSTDIATFSHTEKFDEDAIMAAFDVSFYRLRQEVKTPKEAQFIINEKITYAFDKIKYGGEFHAPAIMTYQENEGDCEDGAFLFAALLADDGLISTIGLLKNSGNGNYHAIALYKTKNGYGSGGINDSDFTTSIPFYLH